MANASTSSGDIAVGTNAVTGAGATGRLMSLILFGGSAASTIVVYDNPSAASGTVLARFNVAANTCWSDHFGDGLAYNTGLTVVVAGTAAIGVAHYVRG